jgi:hypothetical protein
MVETCSTKVGFDSKLVQSTLKDELVTTKVIGSLPAFL